MPNSVRMTKPGKLARKTTKTVESPATNKSGTTSTRRLSLSAGLPAEIGNMALVTDHVAKYNRRPTRATAA